MGLDEARAEVDCLSAALKNCHRQLDEKKAEAIKHFLESKDEISRLVKQVKELEEYKARTRCRCSAVKESTEPTRVETDESVAVWGNPFVHSEAEKLAAAEKHAKRARKAEKLAKRARETEKAQDNKRARVRDAMPVYVLKPDRVEMPAQTPEKKAPVRGFGGMFGT